MFKIRILFINKYKICKSSEEDSSIIGNLALKDRVNRTYLLDKEYYTKRILIKGFISKDLSEVVTRIYRCRYEHSEFC